MGKPQRKKRTHKNIKDFKKKFRTRRKTKDIDQIHDDTKPEKIDLYLHQKIDPDLPGEGQHYCLYCARYFINERTLIDHKKTKSHKKRMRSMKEAPYSQAEAELAAGMGSYTVKIKPSVNQSEHDAKNTNNMDVLSPASTVTNTASVMDSLTIG